MNKLSGIVTLMSCCGKYSDNCGYETNSSATQCTCQRCRLLCRLPVSTRCDQLCGVAVLPFSVEPAHGRGVAGRPWHRPDLRDGATLVGEGWPGYCPAHQIYRTGPR